ncbi:hypothetical protein CJD38_10795 [Stenotrophobium rhamnosiphilum]|uniref:Transposase n=1 Tax=Stenotrophobium rhamnosiphilum TaxID=2029166 RepID=A0A2T5MDZ1_9GAMM|nr:hypothetical protein CJD38_14820 [Stenotrophobium rhamnosiphilum]PTU30795.1 hypothetical protein CJD38_10795 [Stenotrophobium rhamnosiphilum]
MSGKRYTAEFKAEAIKQVTERGYSITEVAGRLGVTKKTFYTWLQKKGVTRGQPQVQAGADLERENLRLKAELKRVEEERDILKKAAAYFAKMSG